MRHCALLEAGIGEEGSQDVAVGVCCLLVAVLLASGSACVRQVTSVLICLFFSYPDSYNDENVWTWNTHGADWIYQVWFLCLHAVPHVSRLIAVSHSSSFAFSPSSCFMILSPRFCSCPGAFMVCAWVSIRSLFGTFFTATGLYLVICSLSLPNLL